MSLAAPKHVALILGASAAMLGGCDLSPKSTVQNGFRGTGIQQVIDTKLLKVAADIPPEPYPLGPDEGQRASEIYQNVQVLGYTSADDFNRIMLAMNTWIGTGEQGCAYCHNVANMASDEKYTKVVARKMLQMTRNINNNWTSHVHNTGVTCWTCHRGNPVPVYHWNKGDPAPDPLRLRGNNHGQNMPSATVAYASLPHTPFETFLSSDPKVIRVAANSPYPSADHKVAIQSAEATYGLMQHMSSSLGVNCTYCHNTQSFRQWSLSRPQRANAWYGIRMVRDTNVNYISTLASVFPAYRKGPQGDPNKANCGTCHQGQAKPMGGYPMLAQYPALKGPRGSVSLTPVVAQPDVPLGAASPTGGEVASITATIPTGVRMLTADATATAQSCNADFGHLLAGQTIEFDTGSAGVRPQSRPLLDKLAAVAGRCSAFRMEVDGHTDAVGSAAANLDLSRDRARAVAEYLVSRGVDPRHLAAVGFGQNRPKDAGGAKDNQTNRRIEITVTPAGAAAPMAGTNVAMGRGPVAARDRVVLR